MNRRGFFARVAALFAAPVIPVKVEEKNWGVSPYSKCIGDFNWWSHSVVLFREWKKFEPQWARIHGVDAVAQCGYVDNWGEK